MTNSTKPHRKLLKLGTGGMKMRLIDADKALKIAESYGTTHGTTLGRHSGVADTIYDEIAKLPTIEAQPVRHGVWRLMHNSYDRVKEYNCSNCDANHIREYNFCPSCGARMVGGDNST